MDSSKTPISAKVLCVCGHVVTVPVQERKEIICDQCNTVLWIEPVKYDEQNDILYVRPVAKVPTNFIGTLLPNAPRLVQPEWRI